MASSDAWPKEAIIAVLAVSLAATSYLLLIGCKHLYLTFVKARQGKTKDGSWSNLATSVAQVVAALSNLLDQSLLLDEVINPPLKSGNGCFPLISDLAYMLFQLCATVVLIRRATAVVPKRSGNRLYRRDFFQVAFLLVFLAGYLPIVVSILMRHAAASNGATCKIPIAINLNSAGKIVFVFLYTSLAVCFSFPLIRHMRTMASASQSRSTGGHSSEGTGGAAATVAASSAGSHEAGTQRKPATMRSTDVILRELLHNVTLRIMIAVVVYLVTAIWKMVGGFAGAFQVAFALQNISALYAATLAGKAKRTSKGSAAPSSVAAGKLLGATTVSPVKSVDTQLSK